MIKEDKVLVSINLKNVTYYRNLGYVIENFDIKKKYELIVNVEHIPKKSHNKITAICQICNSENIITIQKYYVNYERNSKGFYSCFNCKNIEKEKTCLVKYGFKSYSQTQEYKITESEKWKGIKKGSEKGRKTMLEKYGVDSYFKTKEMKEMNKEWMSSQSFKDKSKQSMVEKYGVDHFSKTKKFKDSISSKKEIIVAKIKETFMEKYGVEWISQSEDILQKSLQTRIDNGNMVSIENLDAWKSYSRVVKKLTSRVVKKLYESWNGMDYYDGEFIKGNFCYGSGHRLYPTIDHKISVYYGFKNNIPAEEIADISNLCITKRSINSAKRDMIDTQYQQKISG